MLNRRTWLFFVLCLIFLVVGCTPTLESSVDSTSVPILIFESYDDELKLISTMPLNGTEMRKIAHINRNERYEVSPTGQQMAIYLGSDLRLIHMESGGVTVLLQDVTMPTVYFGNIDHKFLAWSPDGTKLAALTGGVTMDSINESAPTDVLIFDVMTGALLHKYENHSWVNDIAWSNDSTSLAISEFSIPCIFEQTCVEEKQQQVAVNLTVVTENVDSRWIKAVFQQMAIFTDGMNWRGYPICDLHWSSSDRHIMYTDFCELGSLSTNRSNQYVVDIYATQISQPILPEQKGYSRNTYTRFGQSGQNLVLWVEHIDGRLPQINSRVFEDTNDQFTLSYEYNSLEIDYTSPAFFTFSPESDPIYAMLSTRDGPSFLFNITSSDLETSSIEIGNISPNGLWVGDAFLSQRNDEIISINFARGDWSVVQENIPEGFKAVGWYYTEAKP